MQIMMISKLNFLINEEIEGQSKLTGIVVEEVEIVVTIDTQVVVR